MNLDETDHRLLALLRQDGRMSTTLLARHLGVSRGTVQNRIDRLREGGVLLGFTIRLRGDTQTAGVRAAMSIGLRSSDARAVVAALRRMPAVARLHSTNGQWDLIAEILAPDLAALDAVLVEIRALGSVANTETSILLRELK